MRWRLTGTVTYTDGVRRPWQTVPSLTQLLVQVDAAYPTRHAADGTAAGQGHFNTNPSSDHTPDVNGDVRAGDIGEVVENDAFDVAESIRLSRDPRVKYVIHEGRLFSSYPHSNGAPYTWRPYSGSNPHSSHVHVSVLASNQTNVFPWDIGGSPLPPEDDMAFLSEDQQKELAQFLDHIKAKSSNVGFVNQAIDDIRQKNAAGDKYAPDTHNHGDSGGLSQEDADARYVRKGQPVVIKGTN